jgi:hypothetical protein
MHLVAVILENFSRFEILLGFEKTGRVRVQCLVSSINEVSILQIDFSWLAIQIVSVESCIVNSPKSFKSRSDCVPKMLT